MISVPSKATLSKYGLSEAEWKAIGEKQGWVCFVCLKEPSTGRLVIDHEHAKKWKQMPPEQRKLYVRGLLCWWCNHAYLGRGISVDKSKRVTLYLQEYEERKPK